MGDTRVNPEQCRSLVEFRCCLRSEEREEWCTHAVGVRGQERGTLCESERPIHTDRHVEDRLCRLFLRPHRRHLYSVRHLSLLRIGP